METNSKETNCVETNSKETNCWRRIVRRRIEVETNSSGDEL